ncbi:hypothetical protein J6590_029236 [Homalodisca vitripennis]|nr:hypothetical protein J6590_029236 [Homalodisca vitripennis]
MKPQYHIHRMPCEGPIIETMSPKLMLVLFHLPNEAFKVNGSLLRFPARDSTRKWSSLVSYAKAIGISVGWRGSRTPFRVDPALASHLPNTASILRVTDTDTAGQH